MSSLVMSREEREAFLADVHVGVLSIGVEGRAPLTVPVWYSYQPGGLVSIVTGRESRKAAAIRVAGEVSVCVQTEESPPRYVSISGPVVEMDGPIDPEERKALAYRYLGPELGEMYHQSTQDELATSVMIRIDPQRWLSGDFSKMQLD
jgi:nitroimidazol reductase NimA-like FMN-containing flavoprotein (pyridoxamine 5'-phosphate oxidase superfamily)